MSDNSFRRNLFIIAGLHILVIAGLYFGGVFSSKKEQIAWISDGGGSPPGAQSTKPDETSQEETPAESTPEPTPDKSRGKMETPSAPSEIVLSTPTPHATIAPTPTPTPRPTPTATPTPRPTPTATPTPKPTAKPSPSPTPKKKTPSPSPKPSPKKSASPKPSASAKPSASVKPSATPKSTEGTGDESVGEAKTPSPKNTKGTAATQGAGGDEGTKPGTGGGDRGGNGKKGGVNAANELGWYISLLQERFTSRWLQPAGLEDGLSTIVKIRIEKDGHVSSAELAKSSGNAIMDESVMTAAHSVKQIAPLPSSVEDGFLVVPIEFKFHGSN